MIQSLLAGSGVRSFVENADFLTWFWQYGVAVGGAAVYVMQSDAQEALRMLAPQPQHGVVTCPQCSERLQGGWSVCWRCAATDRPIVAADFGDDDPGFDLLGIAVVVSAILVVVLGVSMILPFAVLTILFAIRIREADSAQSLDAPVYAELIDAMPNNPHERRDAFFNRLVQRIWWSTILGIFNFPPLVFYAAWLLARANQHVPRLNTRALRLYYFSGFLVALTLLVYFLLAAFIFMAMFSRPW